MRRLFPILLIGTLSMLFAEVFSGSSQLWFLNPWSLLVTFPLYLTHVLFFLWVALRFKKTALYQLYFFGVIFALYESWITKVLWSGYIDSAGPKLGTLLGIGIFEFPILVFFWHPIMSFILPILVFEILTKKVLKDHDKILEKTKEKTLFISIFLILISTFIAFGNKFDFINLNFSFIGTILFAALFLSLFKKADLKIFEFSKRGFSIIAAYLSLLYIFTFFVLVPERIPNTIIPYLTIILFYIITILLLQHSNTNKIKVLDLEKDQYQTKDLFKFALLMIISINVASFFPMINNVFLAITYTLLSIIGTILFALTVYNHHNKRKAKRASH